MLVLFVVKKDLSHVAELTGKMTVTSIIYIDLEILFYSNIV